MLSAKHHILYWLLSLSTLLIQALRQATKQHLSVDYDSQAFFDYAAASYTIFFCLGLIGARMPGPPPPKWKQQQRQQQQPERKKNNGLQQTLLAVVEALIEKRAWFFEFGTAVMFCVAGDMALWLGGVGEDDGDSGRGRAVRVLGTFVFLGMVEPVWRDVSFLMNC
ncbi:hypothetical protein ACQKWADRAFT_285126 [Trichoderma austrokoningii]